MWSVSALARVYGCNAVRKRAMREPEALSAPEQIGVGRTRLAMESLEAFVSEHYSRLVRLAGLVTRDVDQAQDAVQAALERAWRKREQANADSVRPWLDPSWSARRSARPRSEPPRPMATRPDRLDRDAREHAGAGRAGRPA